MLAGTRPTLRPYQAKLKADTYAAWAEGARVVMAVAPTGAGKTVLFSDVLQEHNGASCAIAHRQELVSQISLALARNGVRHRIIGQDKTRKLCQRLHLRKLGRHFVDANARCAVAGIRTLVGIKPTDPEHAWLAQVSLWIGDEGHHFLTENEWGRGVAMFSNPSVRGLLVTATPRRADGRGLGSWNDGLADVMVLAPSMRDLINMGYLTDYQVYAPPCNIDWTKVPVGASGEFVQSALAEATKGADMVGDVVDQYLKIAPGKLGITFAVDVEEAGRIAQRFRERGVAAEVVHAKTPDEVRADVLARFERREVLQLVNVDLFGEGFDLPAIEVVSMARGTNSWSLFCQQWGRALRLMIDPNHMAAWDSFTVAQRWYLIARSAKPTAIIIDHVGNVLRHNGPPDKVQQFSLERREKRSSGPSDAIPYRVCSKCTNPFPRTSLACPRCGHVPAVAVRSAPVHVDGDLHLLDADALAFLRGEVDRIDGEADARGHDMIAFAIRKRHVARQEAQAALRQAMQWYGGYLRDVQGVSGQGEAWRHFFFKFGTDVASAQALGATEANQLRERVAAELARAGVAIPTEGAN